MSYEQYRTGLISQITNGSQIVIGTASCDWRGNISGANVFKIDRDSESTYVLASILTATRMLLNANYGGETGTGLSYMVCRSFTTNMGYWRPLQGDADFAEILSQNTIDKIDEDIASLSASIGIAKINASIGNLASNIVNANASIDALQQNMINANASISAIDVSGINASLNRANASIDALQDNIIDANASIDNLQTNVVNANASIGSNRTSITRADASINRANASIDALQLNIVNANASIDELQSNVINANASIGNNRTNIINANASIEKNTGSISALQNNMINANASIGINKTNIDVANASIARFVEASIGELIANMINANASIERNTASLAAHNSNLTNLDASVDRNTASISGLKSIVDNANASIGRNTSSITSLISNIINANASITYFKEEFIPIEWGKNASYAPDAAEDIMQSYQTVVVRKFRGASYDQKLSFVLRAPTGIQSDTLRFRPHVIITQATPPSAEGLVFGMRGHSRFVGASYGTEITASKLNMDASQYSQDQLNWSPLVTIASLSGGRLTYLEYIRRQSSSNDDYVQKIGVPGFDIRWI